MRLPVAKHLSDKEYEMFLRTYDAHMRAMGEDKRKAYLLTDIKKIERNKAERCFHVYYKNGDWWHYTSTNQWY